MIPHNKLRKLIFCIFILICACTTVRAQTAQPVWWFGLSGAANLNFYDGTTQTLNNSLVAPTPFHKGFGVRPYGSLLMEYRPGRIWGFMLNVAYDDRGAKYDNVVAPCNCLTTLKTNINYISVEPSLRIGFKSTNLYFFTGPRLAYNINNNFFYTQVRQPNSQSSLIDMNKTQVSGQVGIGYDFMVSAPASTTMVSLSPFLSYQPYFGQEPRNIESLSITTVRIGVALKFGKVHKTSVPAESVMIPYVILPVHDFIFAVYAPKSVPLKRQVSETFPLINVVFFDEASSEIPSRYVTLTNDQASRFKEIQLQNQEPESMAGRSAGQLNVYHNILNILGDRMRENPGITISLNGASAKGPKDGRALAESIKLYITNVFGIDGSRITTHGSYKPDFPSEQPGGNKDMALLRAEDRRVDIESTSPELLMEVGGGMMKPVQIVDTQLDPMDGHVIFKVDSAKELLKSWSVEITDISGTDKHYGPYTTDRESVPGRYILGNNNSGDYTVTMTGETNDGSPVKKESSIHLVRQDQTIEKGLRYSIIFNFNKANTITSYDSFLTSIVSPLITNGATVIIHGHTDIIGEDAYNQKLSDDRAVHTQKIIEKALSNAGKENVKFETLGFGKDINHSPFENNLPEERFYNRTVIIDIIPVK